MYSVNSIPLDNPEFGWSFRAPSKPLSEFTHDVQSLTVQGRDGVVAGLPATTRPVTLPFVVQTPKQHLETLIALFGRVGMLSLAGVGSKEVAFEVLAHTLTGYGAADEVVDATFMLRLPGAFWRAKTESTFTAPLTSASVSVTCWPADDPTPPFWVEPGPGVQFVLWDSVPNPDPATWVVLRNGGLSAPVQDALVRVKGPATGIQVTDSSGAWVRLPDVTAGQWVRFESETGLCFRTTTDTWAGGTDVSGDVDYGGPRTVFEITPTMVGGPADRAGVITVTTVTRGGAVDVRGKSAHAL